MQIIDTAHSQLLAKAMDTYSLRQEITASNIANIDTPGYKRHQVEFESALQEAQKSGKVMHKVNPSIAETGDDVILEDELLEMADTQMRVQLVTRSLRHYFDTLKAGITSTTR